MVQWNAVASREDAKSVVREAFDAWGLTHCGRSGDRPYMDYA
jgi:CDGSH-type Zn-finger protein